MGGNSEKEMTDFPGDKTALVRPRTARCVFGTLFLTVRRPAKKDTSPKSVRSQLLAGVRHTLFLRVGLLTQKKIGV